jgi:hypothetical protein
MCEHDCYINIIITENIFTKVTIYKIVNEILQLKFEKMIELKIYHQCIS